MTSLNRDLHGVLRTTKSTEDHKCTVYQVAHNIISKIKGISRPQKNTDDHKNVPSLRVSIRTNQKCSGPKIHARTKYKPFYQTGNNVENQATLKLSRKLSHIMGCQDKHTQHRMPRWPSRAEGALSTPTGLIGPL